MQFLHTVVRQNVSVTANTIVSFDLPSLPISFIVFTLRYQNLTANTLHTLANVLSAIERVSVVHDGQSIISMNGSDLFAFNVLFYARVPWGQQRVNTANGVSSISLLIPFSRFPYDPNECFPSSRRGALQMEIDYASSFTNITGLAEQIECVQLPEANPQSFIRAVSQTLTPTATGQVDMDLPIGNLLLGVQVFSTTVPSGTSRTTSANQIRLLVNDMESHFALTNWDTIHNLGLLKAPPQVFYSSHFHMENLAGAYTQNADTAAAEYSSYDLDNYSYLDLDPTNDSAFAVDTARLSSLKLRFDAGDTNAIRVVPVELIRIGGQSRVVR